MHTMQEPVETIHVYMVREEPKRPYTFLPICAALLCLAVIVGTVAYSGSHPAYVHETLRVPAQYLPLQTFKAAQVIVPTGIKTYPATFAVGILTLTNGSIIAQELPNGFIVTANNGVEVVTDSAVFVPAGGADGYGMSTVPAHLLTSGINLSTLAVDQVIGSSLYVRNLSPFTGGKPAYSLKVVTAHDKQLALSVARLAVTTQAARTQALLAEPCKESVTWSTSVWVSQLCRFVAYPQLAGMRIVAVHLSGKNLFVDVVFIARPKQYRAK